MPRKLTTKEILRDNLSHEPPTGMTQVVVFLHNIRSLHNVGSVFRSSDAFGIKGIYLSGYTPRPPRPEITKTAIGAEEFVEWTDVEDHISTLHSLQAEGYSLIGLEQTDNSTYLPDLDVSPDEKICLIMGNEVTGIDDDVLPLIDTFVAIPQFGQKHSLNVSVASGVVLYALLEKLWHKS